MLMRMVKIFLKDWQNQILLRVSYNQNSHLRLVEV